MDAHECQLQQRSKILKSPKNFCSNLKWSNYHYYIWIRQEKLHRMSTNNLTNGARKIASNEYKQSSDSWVSSNLSFTLPKVQVRNLEFFSSWNIRIRAFKRNHKGYINITPISKILVKPCFHVRLCFCAKSRLICILWVLIKLSIVAG